MQRLAHTAALILALAPLGTTACGSSPKTAGDASATASASAQAGPGPGAAEEVPEPPGPAKLTDAEKGELAGACNLLEPQTYDGLKAGKAVVDEAFNANPKAKPDDGPALEAALKVTAKAPSGMSPTEHKRCVELFKKSATRDLWEYEPAEVEARNTLAACQKSAAAMFGKSKLTFGDSGGPASNSPFCPDGDAVPPKLAALPYQSVAADWDSPGWRCMKFGMRVSQPFQVAYESTPTEFSCTARFETRQGGSTIELRLGGTVQEQELKIHKKATRKRLRSQP